MGSFCGNYRVPYSKVAVFSIRENSAKLAGKSSMGKIFAKFRESCAKTKKSTKLPV